MFFSQIRKASTSSCNQLCSLKGTPGKLCSDGSCICGFCDDTICKQNCINQNMILGTNGASCLGIIPTCFCNADTLYAGSCSNPLCTQYQAANGLNITCTNPQSRCDDKKNLTCDPVFCNSVALQRFNKGGKCAASNFCNFDYTRGPPFIIISPTCVWN